ncbi:MAG: cytochrome c3 family protein [Desulfuromonas sp.]|nr:cytochrome c3 family protein [Desulfuromonas sp.]
MKTKLLFIALFTMVCATTAIAADQYQYTGKGTVSFNHKMHGEKLECSACHTTATPEKMAITNKKEGHDKCLVCHKAEKKNGNNAAPTSCSQCHKK